ncbi:RagB/SusD family nutrient uptake outer membrane protein [Maribacter sp. MMG018]|uniref:RagB/SusD family nutrient uptake outer membrane protein n=1 Tax=Maribacter sp. MMG018 TaxID=2822688 RepID=UPI001B358EE4|nr:RagB/SusD family nutrient uptake outer membrane protein [Maribacter sp. MMG018]MBQ4913791.1 RagB/SusD family nutrient uptake outer membrane protein [Maribacter sp. MMG018]
MKKFKIILIAILGFSCMQSCELEPEVYSEIRPENFFEDDEQLIAFTSSAYSSLNGWFGQFVQEQGMMTDEMANPLRSNDGWGTNTDIMSHNFRANDNWVGGVWGIAFSGVATCNRLIEFLEGLDTDQNTAIAELRALRALYLWAGMDTYGNIPVELRFAEANPTPSQVSPAEAFAVIEEELLAAIPDLNPSKDQTTYAKMNRAAGNMLLATLYINAERYGVSAKWAEAAAAAQEVIDTGDYSLESGYFSNFMISNEGSSENILVIPYERNQIDNSIAHATLHQSSSPTFGLASQPWGGYSVQGDFYNSFDENDNRRGMFITGQQYTKDAGPIWDATLGFLYSNPKEEYEITDCGEDYNILTNVERAHWGFPELEDGQTAADLSPEELKLACGIVIMPNPDPIMRDESGRAEDMILYREGARMAKYEYEVGTNVGTGSNNDFPIFRYAETILIRAEALWRLDNGSVEALSLVNQIRDRAGLPTLGALTEDDLYQEYRHELALEGRARPIIIRFGHWEDEWNWKSSDPAAPGDTYVPDVKNRWYPIPENELNSNPELVQNTGF